MFAACVLAYEIGSGDAATEPVPPPPRSHVPWEITSQVSNAGGVRYDSRVPGAQGIYSTALRMDMIIGRERPRGWGLGWFASTRVDNFSNVALSGGVSILMPASDTFPFVLSLGTAGRWDNRDGLAFGATERLWWGPRSENYEGHYVLSAGIFVESRQFADPIHTVDVIVGIDLDLELTAIPFMALYTWIFRTDPRAR